MFSPTQSHQSRPYEYVYQTCASKILYDFGEKFFMAKYSITVEKLTLVIGMIVKEKEQITVKRHDFRE